MAWYLKKNRIYFLFLVCLLLLPLNFGFNVALGALLDGGGGSTPTPTTPSCTSFVCPSGAICFPNPLTACTLEDFINRIINFFFIIGTAMVSVAVLYGAYNILTSGGKPEKVNAGINIVVYAILGELVILIAKIIPFIIKEIIH